MSESSLQPQQPDSQESQLDSLKSLLIDHERHEIDTLRRRLDDPDVRADETAKVLSKSIRISSDQDQELPVALEKPMLAGMRHSIQKNPDEIAGLLFPVMGPAIRQAITDTLRKMIDSINHAVEHSFSLQGLKWRMESMRSGIPFTEVVLRHTLDYRVEQVLLIQPESGLLVQDIADSHLQTHDPDTVSAMLTAISNFVREAFLADGGKRDLDEVTMGDHKVLIVNGPKAYLACAVRGIPSAELRDICRGVLESIHRHYGEELAGFDGNREKMQPIRGMLEQCLLSKEKETPKKRGPSPALLIFIILLAAAGYFVYGYWQELRAQQQLISLLEQSPGIIVTKTGVDEGKLVINGLRDPMAENPELLVQKAGLSPSMVKIQLTPYLDMDRKFAIERAKSRMQPPPTVTLTLTDDGILRAAGSASEQWLSQAKLLALTVPGIRAFDDSKMLDPDQLLLAEIKKRLQSPAEVDLRVKNGALYIKGAATLDWIKHIDGRLAGLEDLKSVHKTKLISNERLELERLKQELESLHILFTVDEAFSEGQTELLDKAAADMRKIEALGGKLSYTVSVTLVGRTDGTGTRAYNAELAQNRSAKVRNYLIDKGISPTLLSQLAAPPPLKRAVVDPTLKRVEFMVSLNPTAPHTEAGN